MKTKKEVNNGILVITIFGFLIGLIIGAYLAKAEFPKDIQKGYERYNQILDREEDITVQNHNYKCIKIN